MLFGLYAISREIIASYAKYKILLLFFQADPQIIIRLINSELQDKKKHSFDLFCISRDSFLESMSSKVETIGRISEDGISKIQKVLLSDTECGKGIGGNPLDSSDLNF